MAWWMPVVAAAGGYMIDKKMGGSGLQGAMLGGSLGYGAGGAGAGKGAVPGELVASEAAGSTIPAHLTSAGGAGAGANIVTPQFMQDVALNNPTAGLTEETMSMFTPDGVIRGSDGLNMSSSSNLLGQTIPTEQTMDAALSGNKGLLSDSVDFIKDEYEDMSLLEKLAVAEKTDEFISPEEQEMINNRIEPLGKRAQSILDVPLTTRIQDNMIKIPKEDERYNLLASKYPLFTG
jgi:hypothetical protein